MEKVLSYKSPVHFGLPFRSNCPLFKITLTIMDKNILMMKNYADEILKILNKSYYLYSTSRSCV